jgi:hypothetical protein
LILAALVLDDAMVLIRHVVLLIREETTVRSESCSNCQQRSDFHPKPAD